MTLAQAEAFVQTVYQSTGRLPLVYTHPNWADGAPSGRGRVRLTAPISSSSILARCDLWLADYREEPQLPSAWARRGWRLWQYAGNETEADAAYGSEPRAVAGVSHCDRNLFAGDTTALYKFWNGHRSEASGASSHLRFLARSIASEIKRCASPTSPQPCTFTHLPGSRSL